MLRRLQRGSSSWCSKEIKNEENEKPKYNLPSAAEIWPCEWPCDAFLQAARIYQDFYHLAGNAGIADFLLDRCNQYLLLTNTFVQNFHFHARKSPPTVDFHLYDEYKEMMLYDFCEVCKLPYEGSIDEPHPRDVEDFIDEFTVGERRKVSEARVSTLHFSCFALLIIICLEIFNQSGGVQRPQCS